MENNSRPPQPPPPVMGYPPPPGYPSPVQGYPYNNPPPPYHSPPPPPPRTSFLCRFLALILGFFAIFTTISFITFLILRPTIPKFSLASLTVSNFSLSSETLTGNWDARFSISNPNKKLSISYDQIEAYIYYGRDFLTETSMTPFVQGVKNQTEVMALFGARGRYVGAWVAREMTDDMKKDGVVRVDVRVLARTRFFNGAWDMRHRMVRVLCPDVKLKLTDYVGGFSGNLVIGTYDCWVGV